MFHVLQTESFNSTLPGHARECNQLSTGVILLADIIPGLLIKTFAPFLGLYVKYVLISCNFYNSKDD